MIDAFLIRGTIANGKPACNERASQWVIINNSLRSLVVSTSRNITPLVQTQRACGGFGAIPNRRIFLSGLCVIRRGRMVDALIRGPDIQLTQKFSSRNAIVFVI